MGQDGRVLERAVALVRWLERDERMVAIRWRPSGTEVPDAKAARAGVSRPWAKERPMMLPKVFYFVDEILIDELFDSIFFQPSTVVCASQVCSTDLSTRPWCD